MARPRAEIDAESFEKLCAMFCTREEICTWFGITEKTLNAWCKRTYGQGFSLVYEQKRENGKISLRRAQFQLAKKSATMAIFLGKNYLGQSDTPKGLEEQTARIEQIKATTDRIKGVDGENDDGVIIVNDVSGSQNIGFNNTEIPGDI